MKLPKLFKRKPKEEPKVPEASEAPKSEATEGQSEPAKDAPAAAAPTDPKAEKASEEKPAPAPEAAAGNTPKPAKVVSKSGETKQFTPEELEQMVTKSISQVNSVDYVTIKVHKQAVLITAGVAILTMWIAPVLPSVVQRVPRPSFSLSELKNKFSKDDAPEASAAAEATESAEASPSAQPAPEEASDSAQIKRDQVKVRIRNASEAPAGDSLKELLDSLKYQVIDIVRESNLSYTGVQVVVRRGDDAIRQALMTDLSTKYTTIASGSAELTSDSDFDAVVIIGAR